MEPGYFLGIVVLIVVLVIWRRKSKQRARKELAVPSNYIELLAQTVPYYQRLSDPEKSRFAAQVKSFLETVNIEGVRTSVEPLDRILVAAASVIPSFGFQDWKYFNLTNIILYPGAFDEEYRLDGERRPIAGMVGSGALNGQMLLSRPAVRAGFFDIHGKHNTAVHEFVHLLDKADGIVDGVPEKFLRHTQTEEWEQIVAHEIEMIDQGESDINPYGATNHGEFLAVASEYFFQQPERMKENHPDLFRMLSLIFHQQLA
ncbi:zinc-dependent peptidase [Chitinophaga horti]|uniref:Zinc-dependent peptidase n=1 Tax=Chitinophaga horti TaxID=2920382 RepID=A0ABY6J607_9BACT|nr:M90 family metallopeptidase [Chitinophaga horti]UYQ95118.1 zinc-dependent peptidase [Chitinophaga horti]